jgi:hypothetical protein
MMYVHMFMPVLTVIAETIFCDLAIWEKYEGMPNFQIK